jgi:hypothetical protein
VVVTVWGACAKYPICDFFVTIHVTLMVLVLFSLKTGKKLERYSRSYNAFSMAKLFWVCVVVTTNVVTKPKLVSLNKYTQCITRPRIESSRLVPSTEQSHLSPSKERIRCWAMETTTAHQCVGIRCWATEYMSASAC